MQHNAAAQFPMPARPTLRRRLGLPLLVLYGTHVTVGAAGAYPGKSNANRACR